MGGAKGGWRRDWVGSARSAFSNNGVESGREMQQHAVMYSWLPGYKQAELDEAQERYEFRFPPDLVALLLERQPAPGFNWRGENDSVRRMLRWPLEMLIVGVEQGFWWPDWGERPDREEERGEIVESALRTAPRLIPILGHRFIPELPSIAGNPVFSMYGFDTIYYGANLTEYFRNEFEGKHEIGPVRHIQFWSEIVERPEQAYSFYAATRKPDADLSAVRESFGKKD
ncbi:MAG: hypothetical protein ACTHKR_11920 [Sphingomonas sp.]